MTKNQWICIFDIIEKYQIDPNEDPISAAEHDEIYFNLTVEECPEDSKDGKMLLELGCSVDEYGETWMTFV